MRGDFIRQTNTVESQKSKPEKGQLGRASERRGVRVQPGEKSSKEKITDVSALLTHFAVQYVLELENYC